MSGGYRFGDITRAVVAGVSGIASGTMGTASGADSSCFDEGGPPARMIRLSSAAGRLLAAASVGQATADFYSKYTGENLDYQVVRDMFLDEGKWDTEATLEYDLDPLSRYQSRDQYTQGRGAVIMPGSQYAERHAVRALDAKLTHVVSMTKDLETGAGKHAYVLLKYDDNTIDVTDFMADAGTECQNFIDQGLSLKERVRIRCTTAQTPCAPCEKPHYRSINGGLYGQGPLILNFGLPALEASVRGFPGTHYPIALYDMKVNEMGQPRDLLTRAQVSQLIAELSGKDARTQERVAAGTNAEDIRAAYNEAGKGGWLFVRYHQEYSNCHHYQRAIIQLLTGYNDDTINLVFRATEYQRLCMEADGESNVK